MRKTKIVCTIGPASESPEMARNLSECCDVISSWKEATSPALSPSKLNASKPTYE